MREVRSEIHNPHAQQDTALLPLLDPGVEIVSDRWRSPRWIMEMFSTYHDPCPIDWEIDAFSYDWCEHHDQVYVNPPFSNPKPWVEKAISEINKYPDSTIVMLLTHDSSTQWYRMLHEAGAFFLMFQGRLDFDSPDGFGIVGSCSSRPSLLVVLSGYKSIKPNHSQHGYILGPDGKIRAMQQMKIFDYKEDE